MSNWINELKEPLEFILLEDGTFILQESGDSIYLEQPGNPDTYWTKETRIIP